VKLKATRRIRRFDRERGCYVYDVSFTTQAPLTERTIEVAEAFGLGVDETQEHVLYRDFEFHLAEGDVVYIPPDEIGVADCRDKIVLADQQTAGDWMGLRDGLLLRLQEMGVKGLIVVEQDDYMPSVVHQRADFSVSGSPTSDNISLVQTIPAIVHVSNKDGGPLKRLVKGGGVRARVTSVVDTGWKTLYLLEAEIKGAMDPEKFLLVNGHVDTPPFSPGVTDNASGDVAMIELARILNKHKDKLRRSVRFAFWPGHELGRYAGSTWYNDAHWHEIRYNCVGFYNIDSPGVRGATRYVARHTSAETEQFCRSIIERVTGQANVPVHRPARAADQAFLANGVPSFSTYPLLPEDHPDRWAWTGGSANAWWWHSEHDTLDKTDKNILALDTQISLTAVLELANAETLPFEHVSTAQEIYDFAVELQDKVADHLDLSRVLAEAKRFQAAAQKLEDAKGQVGGDPAKGEKLNVTLMRLSRVLNPVIYSQRGRFQHDPAEWSPIMRATGRYTLAALGRAVELPHLAGKTTYGFLRAQAVRERNRVVTALHEAVRLTEGVLALL